MKKAIITSAQKLAALKVIPQQKLPSTLQTKIQLPNISEIKLTYRPMCKNVGSSLQFIRKYGASIRYYNQDIKVFKSPEKDGSIAMLIEVKKKDSPIPVVVNPNQYKTPEELLDKIRQIDTQL